MYLKKKKYCLMGFVQKYVITLGQSSLPLRTANPRSQCILEKCTQIKKIWNCRFFFFISHYNWSCSTVQSAITSSNLSTAGLDSSLRHCLAKPGQTNVTVWQCGRWQCNHLRSHLVCTTHLRSLNEHNSSSIQSLTSEATQCSLIGFPARYVDLPPFHRAKFKKNHALSAASSSVWQWRLFIFPFESGL